MRLLLVDDDADTTSVLAELLRRYGHEVITLNDGFRVVATARAFRPAVILLDLGLPLVDGYEVASQVRNDERCDGIAIVALTALSHPSFQERATAYGFDAYLIKPTPVEQLVEVIQRVGTRA